MSNLQTFEHRLVFFDRVAEGRSAVSEGTLLNQLGGKNSSLVKLASLCDAQTNSLKVPPGFALTTSVWDQIVDSSVKFSLRMELDRIDPSDIDTLRAAGKNCRDIVYQASGIQDWLKPLLSQGYDALCRKVGKAEVSVAVRSSATAEDLPSASFAGQHDSFLNVCGIDEIFEAVRRCLASVFTDRAIAYRKEQQYDSMSVKCSVGVQMMVRSDIGASGVCFTCDTESGCEDIVVINSSHGLGESVVGGLVNPDCWYVHAPTFRQGYRCVLHRTLGSKVTKMVYNPHDKAVQGEVETLECLQAVETTAAERKRFSLMDEEVLAVAGDALLLQQSFGKSLDIEFATDHDQIYIVQARSETVHASKTNVMTSYTIDAAKAELKATGNAIGEKVGAGVAHICSANTQVQAFQAGDVLITQMTTPDMVPLLKKAAAVITEHGGVTSHAAIVCRELGIPAVIGVENATTRFHSGEQLTVSCCDGSVGKVYAGLVAHEIHYLNPADIPKPTTHVKTNLGDPSIALRTAMQYNEHGAGLVRMEFVISSIIGVHPMTVLNPQKVSSSDREAIKRLSRGYASPVEWYINKLAEGLGLIAAAFYPKPVIIRFSDHKSNEYSQLIGGSVFEEQEENPFLGFRGAARYMHPAFKEAFALEVAAIRGIREKCGLTNVEVMLPFVRSVYEAHDVLKSMRHLGLAGTAFSQHMAATMMCSPLHHKAQSHEHYAETTIHTRAGSSSGTGSGNELHSTSTVKVNMMVEIPCNCLLIRDFAKLFDGFSIGSNDLAQLVLGTDRNSTMLQKEQGHVGQDRAVLEMIKIAIVGAHEAGKPIGICGEAPANDDKLVHFLVDLGIDYISVNPSSVLPTLKSCMAAEADISMKHYQARSRSSSAIGMDPLFVNESLDNERGATIIPLGCVYKDMA